MVSNQVSNKTKESSSCANSRRTTWSARTSFSMWLKKTPETSRETFPWMNSPKSQKVLYKRCPLLADLRVEPCDSEKTNYMSPKLSQIPPNQAIRKLTMEYEVDGRKPSYPMTSESFLLHRGRFSKPILNSSKSYGLTLNSEKPSQVLGVSTNGKKSSQKLHYFSNRSPNHGAFDHPCELKSYS